jgi:hypothetical protein
MLLKKLDYKGKHFILQDADIELDFMDDEIGEVDSEHLTQDFIESHVDCCMYYGIPAYYGKDKELNKLINDVYKKLDEDYDK